VPGLTAEDVVDFFELADRNRDGMIDYHEYMSLFEDEDEVGRRRGAGGAGALEGGEAGAGEAGEEGDGATPSPSSADGGGAGGGGREPLAKVEPFGADELREVMVGRRRRELDRQRLEAARRSAQQAAMDLRLYREELQVPLFDQRFHQRLASHQ
jgi:hypothetical protein